jgi:DNA polymerase-3 subunit delta
MSHPVLERHLQRRALRALYLFYGDEEFLMQRALRRLEEALQAQTGEAPLKVVQESQEVGLAEFLAQARMAPLWGSGQLLVLRRADAYPPEALKAILDYLEHPAPRSWIVLMAEGLKTRDVGKHPVWSRLQEQEAALGFWRLREGELYQWLGREAQALGKSLNAAAAQRLAEIVGENLSELSQELNKLALFAGPEKALTPNLVSQLASHSRTYNIFALVDTLGEREASKCLSALDHLLDLGEPPAKILGMLARQLRLLMRIKETPPGMAPEAQARSLGVPQYQLKKMAAQAGRFSVQGLRAHLALLHQADLRLKTSTGDPRLCLEWALLQMGPG